MPNRRRLIVVAFHLPDRGSHYHNELLGYRDAALALGLIPRILVPRTTEPKVAAGLHAERVLDAVAPTEPLDPDSMFGSVWSYADATQNFEGLWAALDRHDPSFDDFVVFTSAYPAAIAGTGVWLGRRPQPHRPSVFFRVVGDECIDGVTGRPTSARVFFRMACADLRTRAGQERVFLLGSSPAIVRAASRAGGRRVFLTALPKHLAFAPGADSARPAQPTVYVHLNPRSGRFVRGLADIIRRVTSEVPGVRFLVKPSSLSAESHDVLDAEIAALAEILPAEQDAAEYLANFQRCTLVLLAYEPGTYTMLCSGVFVEAVSCGKPVVVPDGTSMAEQIALGRGVGTTFAESTLESVTAAVRQALGKAESLCGAASALAADVRAENSSRRYVENIMALAREMPDMEPRYAIGEDVDFSDPPDSRCFMRDGWGKPESWGVWSVERRARLCFRVARERALVLRALVHPFLTTRHPRIVVRVLVAEQEVRRWIFRFDDPDADRPRWCEAPIPFDDSQDRDTALDIAFAIDAPSSPASAGLSGDVRALGFGLQKMSLS